MRTCWRSLNAASRWQRKYPVAAAFTSSAEAAVAG